MKIENLAIFPHCCICKAKLPNDYVRLIHGQTYHFCKECSSQYQMAIDKLKNINTKEKINTDYKLFKQLKKIYQKI